MGMWQTVSVREVDAEAEAAEAVEAALLREEMLSHSRHKQDKEHEVSGPLFRVDSLFHSPHSAVCKLCVMCANRCLNGCVVLSFWCRNLVRVAAEAVQGGARRRIWTTAR
jgi:hypothetical protein